MRKKIILSFSIIVIIAIIGFFSYLYFKDRSGAPPPTPAIKVNTAKVKLMNVPLTRNAVGSLLSPKTILIKPQISGTITKVFIHSGQRVTKGTPLFQLDDIQQKAALAASQASSATAFDTYTRTESLYKASGSQAVSITDVNTTKNDYLTKQAAVIQDQKALRQTQINAPISGTLSVLPQNINVGSVVDTSSTLVTLVTTESLQIDYSLGQADLNLVNIGQKLIAWPLDQPKQRYSTTVSYISPSIDATTRAFNLRAFIADPKHQLKPGLLMKVVQTLKENHPILAIPGVALMPDIAGYSVFTIQKGKAVKLAVTLDERYDKFVGISAGLKSGQTVITSRLDEIKDGARVEAVKAP